MMKMMQATSDTSNLSIGLKAYVDGIAEKVKRLPSAWVRCELHSIKVADRFVRMEFIEVDQDGKQIARVQGGCWPAVWDRIQTDFMNAGVSLEAGSQVMVKLDANISATFGFQVSVSDIDLNFALGDLSARMQAIRKHLQDTKLWNRNRALGRPADFVRVAVIAPAGAAGLGDFRSTADRLVSAGLAEFQYHEVPFQTREAPARIVEVLRRIYRECNREPGRYCAVAIIRGGGASSDLAWLIDQKLMEAVCHMNVPVITGIGHERDKNLLDEVACIPCDTPSKVVEHISATIIQAALEGQRALDVSRAQAEQFLQKHATALTLTANQIDRSARETVRVAEATVRTAAASLEPGARNLLESTQTAIAQIASQVDRSVRETIRVAEVTVRSTASSLEPGARGLLETIQAAVSVSLDQVKSTVRQRRETALLAIREFQRSIEANLQSTLQPLMMGTARAINEINTLLITMPQAAHEAVTQATVQIANDGRQALGIASLNAATVRQQLQMDASRALDDCHASIELIKARAEAMNPQNVLASGYVILRDEAGVPLTLSSDVRAANLITADMRDGSTLLRNEPANPVIEGQDHGTAD